MDTQFIGMLSGWIVLASALPYAVQTYRKKVRPNVTSWTLWTFIGLILLLTYRSSGAEANIWPAVFGFTNPLIIALLAYWKCGELEPLTRLERWCILFGAASLVLWWFVRDREDLAQYALYLAIAADVCAALPTIFFVWRNPSEDRPFAWTLFAFGYGLAIFAITDHTFANYVLPLYMFAGALFISLPLILYRIRNRVPIVQWA